MKQPTTKHVRGQASDCLPFGYTARVALNFVDMEQKRCEMIVLMLRFYFVNDVARDGMSTAVWGATPASLPSESSSALTDEFLLPTCGAPTTANLDALGDNESGVGDLLNDLGLAHGCVACGIAPNPGALSGCNGLPDMLLNEPILLVAVLSR